LSLTEATLGFASVPETRGDSGEIEVSSGTQRLQRLGDYRLFEAASSKRLISLEVRVRIEKISAVTFTVANMQGSVRFYRDVLGMDLVYGGEDAYFSSLRASDAQNPILNLESGKPVTHWGRMIFYVADVDAFWAYLRGKGFHPESPRDASWGERYFHMSDPEGHELSFARPI
jgi:catechol 2,3-dioxygenase-like lactoylglutathione lyase family enzyme